MRSTLVTLSLVTLALGGCIASEPVDDGRLDTRGTEIIGGAPHDGDPAVIYMTIDGRFSCTGSLIAPQVVLTARHCVEDPMGGGAVPAGRIGVGVGPSAETGRHYANVRAVRKTPRPGLEGNDIALLILDRAGDLTPYRVALDSPPAVGARVIGIGYGQTSDTGGGGRKFRGEGRIGELTPTEFVTSGALSCYGDSGGPGFLADGRVFGIVSRGTTDSCERGQTVYTRADAFRPLIESTIAEAGGGAPPDDGAPPPPDEGGWPPPPEPGEEPPPDEGAPPPPEDEGGWPPPPDDGGGGYPPDDCPPGGGTGGADTDYDGCPDHADVWPYDWEPYPFDWSGYPCGWDPYEEWGW